ncbi:MAG: hypothetical protein Q4D04_09515 [Clostridia bacterium]|nr:hypothetical protein [Clostridia bacterium]
MRELIMRLLTLCAISAAAERMKLGRAIGHICSLLLIEAIIEMIVAIVGQNS